VPAPQRYKEGPAPEEKTFLGYVGVARLP
jgi:hypothetical protein